MKAELTKDQMAQLEAMMKSGDLVKSSRLLGKSSFQGLVIVRNSFVECAMMAAGGAKSLSAAQRYSIEREIDIILSSFVVGLFFALLADGWSNAEFEEFKKNLKAKKLAESTQSENNVIALPGPKAEPPVEPNSGEQSA